MADALLAAGLTFTGLRCGTAFLAGAAGFLDTACAAFLAGCACFVCAFATVFLAALNTLEGMFF
ncbi:MAG: hypothetical protein EBR09_02895 [Proteobacteria bacterium]|nr:hypothetical protein [Pseudomonadota bacterium]